MSKLLGSLYISNEKEKLLTTAEVVKVMWLTGKLMYELEDYYYYECIHMLEKEETPDSVFNEQGWRFCEYFCELALYNRENGDIHTFQEIAEIEELSEKVLIHIILTINNTNGYSKMIGG